MITFMWLGRHSFNRRYSARRPHLKVCRIRRIPAPCTTDHRTKSGGQHRGKRINSVDSGLVLGISSSQVGASVSVEAYERRSRPRTKPVPQQKGN